MEFLSHCCYLWDPDKTLDLLHRDAAVVWLNSWNGTLLEWFVDKEEESDFRRNLDTKVFEKLATVMGQFSKVNL